MVYCQAPNNLLQIFAIRAALSHVCNSYARAKSAFTLAKYLQVVRKRYSDRIRKEARWKCGKTFPIYIFIKQMGELYKLEYKNVELWFMPQMSSYTSIYT